MCCSTWGRVRPFRRFLGFSPSGKHGIAIARSRRSRVSPRPRRAGHCMSPGFPHHVRTETPKTGGKSPQQARIQVKMYIRDTALQADRSTCQHKHCNLLRTRRRVLRRRKCAGARAPTHYAEIRRPAASMPPAMHLRAPIRQRWRCSVNTRIET